jgi:hypothetical protein
VTKEWKQDEIVADGDYHRSVNSRGGKRSFRGSNGKEPQPTYIGGAMSSQGSFHVGDQYVNTVHTGDHKSGIETGGRDISEYMEAR